MRTPLAVFAHVVDVLRDWDRDGRHRECLDVADLSVDVLLETIDRSVAPTITQRRLRSEVSAHAVDCRQLLDRARRVASMLFAAKFDVVVDGDVPLIVETDATRLWRATLNFATNAVRATAASGGRGVVAHLTVIQSGDPLRSFSRDDDVVVVDNTEETAAAAAAAAAETEVWLRLDVCDDGPGMPTSVAARAFRQPVRGAAACDGAGLGLLAVRDCVLALRGACGYGTPAPDHATPAVPHLRGQLFWLAFPAKAVRHQAARHPASPAVTWSPRTSSTCSSSSASPATSLLRRSLASTAFLKGNDPDSDDDASSTKDHKPVGVVVVPPRDDDDDDDGNNNNNKTHKLTALIVEDSGPIRLLVKRLLERLGVAVDEATDGANGLELMKRKEHDITLVDFMMPRLHGVECMRHFRQCEAERLAESCASSPKSCSFRRRRLLVGTSANADHDAVTDAFRAGMDAFLPKPVSLAKLTSLVHGLVSCPAGVSGRL
mmetsp:Transcript_11911/g.35775  ORF Transcript_11911/g.35775 Transcript_11911/m.35775 type:complete len:490 (-) Transcript_11911:2296-3765(-)